MFEVIQGSPALGRIVYIRSEFSLSTDPPPFGGCASLLVNDVQMEIDENGKLLYVWGYCPEQSWTPANLEPPNGSNGQLRWVGEPIIPGTSKRLNESALWKVSFDDKKRWLRIGASAGKTVCFAFGPAAMAELADNKISALWLKIDQFLE